jgi:hypothetical protein
MSHFASGSFEMFRNGGSSEPALFHVLQDSRPERAQPVATNVFDKEMLHELTDAASGVSARFVTGEGDRPL